MTAQDTEEEERLMKEKIPVPQEDGSILKLVVEKIISRRQKKSKYEYEVQWKGLSLDATSWMEKEKLGGHGFAKHLVRIDEREAARAVSTPAPSPRLTWRSTSSISASTPSLAPTTASRASPAARRSSSSSPPPCGSSPTSS